MPGDARLSADVGARLGSDRDGPGQWDHFKAGLSAIAENPRLLLNIGPAKMVREAAGSAVRARACRPTRTRA